MQPRMRFAFLTCAPTLCAVGIMAGVLAHRQARREGGETPRCALVTLVFGLFALLFTLFTLYAGRVMG